jgi:hypothetical protein
MFENEVERTQTIVLVKTRTSHHILWQFSFREYEVPFGPQICFPRDLTILTVKSESLLNVPFNH